MLHISQHPQDEVPPKDQMTLRDPLVDEKIMLIGEIWVVSGAGRGKIPIRNGSLNMPTSMLSYPLEDSPMKGMLVPGLVRKSGVQ
jgi:hypothetical protein